jgi:hypothetical protein
MKIFGINFVTKKELKNENFELQMTVKELEGEIALRDEKYPLELGETVYDVALKNAQGKYTKTKPSIEHCTVTPVTVDEKNYFKLVARMRNNDVFLSEAAAKTYLESICK